MAELDDIMEQVALASRMLYEMDLADASTIELGHVSHRLPDEPDKFVIKGGSYLSYQNPIQLHIDVRTQLPTTEYLSGLGFRLAKSLQPGRDAAYSRINSDSLSIVARSESALAPFPSTGLYVVSVASRSEIRKECSLFSSSIAFITMGWLASLSRNSLPQTLSLRHSMV